MKVETPVTIPQGEHVGEIVEAETRTTTSPKDGRQYTYFDFTVTVEDFVKDGEKATLRFGFPAKLVTTGDLFGFLTRNLKLGLELGKDYSEDELKAMTLGKRVKYVTINEQETGFARIVKDNVQLL